MIIVVMSLISLCFVDPAPPDVVLIGCANSCQPDRQVNGARAYSQDCCANIALTGGFWYVSCQKHTKPAKVTKSRNNYMSQSGLRVYDPKTRKIKDPDTWAEFMAKVRLAKSKQIKHPNKVMTRTNGLANLDKAKRSCGYFPVKRPCDFTRNGVRCLVYAMRGATRCHFHGGYRQNPSHPATIRLLTEGRLTAVTANKQAWQALIHIRTTPVGASAEREARQVMQSHGQNITGQSLLEGTLALLRIDNDAGKSWRGWLARHRTRKGK